MILLQPRSTLTNTLSPYTTLFRSALVRLPMMQRQRDLAAGLDTAAYVTGYRGSPLGAVDQQMARARQFLEKHHIRFQAGVNEDLAATAIWGTQQLDLF